MELQWGRWQWCRMMWEKRMSWFRKETAANDRIVAEAGEVLLTGVVDADNVGAIELHTGKNLRDQMTVAEAEAMHQETDLRKFGWRRN